MKLRVREKITWNEALLRIAHGKYCLCMHYSGSTHESSYLYKKDSADIIRHVSTDTWLFTDQVMDCDDILEGKWYECDLI